MFLQDKCAFNTPSKKLSLTSFQNCAIIHLDIYNRFLQQGGFMDHFTANAMGGLKTDRRGEYQLPIYPIIEKGQHEIMPQGIPGTFEHLWNCFDESETEVSAAYLLRFAQMRGNWNPFTYEEINDFYQVRRKSRNSNYTFNRLIEPGMHFGGAW